VLDVFSYEIFCFMDRVTEEKAETRYQGWMQCKEARGSNLPVAFDLNHYQMAEGAQVGRRFIIVGRLDGSIAEIDAKRAEAIMKSDNRPCLNPPGLYQNL
jgi:hypothetical protein